MEREKKKGKKEKNKKKPRAKERGEEKGGGGIKKKTQSRVKRFFRLTFVCIVLLAILQLMEGFTTCRCFVTALERTMIN